MKTSLTGIKPTGVPHLGNYLGAIRPALELAKTYRSIYFIADYHALTTERDPERLRRHTYDVAASWLACGLDPADTILFRQSDVGEVFELAWVFACMLSTGQLERGHSYKDQLAKGESPNAGVFNYPLLMAGDIVLYDTDIVPVGKDQKQHVEVARDVAVRLNHVYGEGTVVVPEARLYEAVQVPGIDGRKMSKSYDNTLSPFDVSKRLRKRVMSIETDSTPLEAPKAPDAIIFPLYQEVASAEEAERMASKLRAGGYGWGHAKQDLFESLERHFMPMRERYAALRADEAALEATLTTGAVRARAIARETIHRVRNAIGISHP